MTTANETETVMPTAPLALCGKRHPEATCARFSDHDGEHRGYGFRISVPLAWTDADVLALWLDAETAYWDEQ